MANPGEPVLDDLRDTEECSDEVAPSDNVYSHFLFESVRFPANKKANIDFYFAAFLAMLCLAVQGILLYAIWGRVVLKNVEWKSQIVDMGDTNWKLIEDMPGGSKMPGGDTSQCNKGESICYMDGGQFTCAPPIVQLTGRWGALDLDGDGIWTKTEVMMARDELKCKYAVDPLEVFDVMRKFLKKREHIIWLHPDVLSGDAIHEAYFRYATGDIIMCGYRSPAMCPNLLKRGFFDAPMRHGTVPRVGNTTSSALEYCRDLLQQDGFCERTLPSTYSVWKIEGEEECRKPKFNQFTFKHPVSGREKALLEVDYSARRDYERAQTPLFIVYKFIMTTIWILTMVYEFKAIMLIMNWIVLFPAHKEGEEAVTDYKEGDETHTTINSVEIRSRIGVGVITFARLLMLMVLSVVGTSLLMRSLEYMTLIMDGVSLVFIVEIAGILYTQVLRQNIRDEIENNVDPMTVQVMGPRALTSRPALVDALWLMLVFIIVGIIMVHYYDDTVIPLYKALECACIGSGEECREAVRFDYDYWYKYWAETTPRIFQDIKTLKMSASNAGATALHAVKRHHHHSHHSHHAVNLLQRLATST